MSPRIELKNFYLANNANLLSEDWAGFNDKVLFLLRLVSIHSRISALSPRRKDCSLRLSTSLVFDAIIVSIQVVKDQLYLQNPLSRTPQNPAQIEPVSTGKLRCKSLTVLRLRHLHVVYLSRRVVAVNPSRSFFSCQSLAAFTATT